MNRNDFQQLARLRLREARVLLQNGCFEGAYYLAGYAVECALKACIAKKVRRYDFPDKDVVSKSYSHKLEQLVLTAGLQTQLNQQSQANRAFSVNWTTVKDWSADKRYITTISRAQARDLYSAITARHHGLMSWLRSQW
jgi:hypothetical protein